MRVGNFSDSAELLHRAKYVTSLLVFLMVPEIKDVEGDYNNNMHINFLPIFHMLQVNNFGQLLSTLRALKSKELISYRTKCCLLSTQIFRVPYNTS